MFDFWKKNETGVVAPVAGRCIALDEVPDQVFSSRLMGDGFAVEAWEDTVVAPISGELVMLADTKHAFGIKARNGMEILVHIGLDTVNLEGEGFTALQKKGSKIKAGEPVIRFDQSVMEQHGLNMDTMVIFTGGFEGKVESDCFGCHVEAGQIILKK